MTTGGLNTGELLGDVVLLGVAGMMINKMGNNNNNNNNSQRSPAPRRRYYAPKRKNTGTVRKTRTTVRKTRKQRENRDWTLGSPFGN